MKYEIIFKHIVQNVLRKHSYGASEACINEIAHELAEAVSDDVEKAWMYDELH